LGKACALMASTGTSCGAGGWGPRRAERTAPLRQFASGRERATPERGHQVMQGDDHPLVTFTQERGENVLADLFAPEMIGAVAPREIAGVQVDPVGVYSTFDPEPPGPDAVGAKPKAALQTVEIDTDRIEVDGKVGHGFLEGTRDAQI